MEQFKTIVQAYADDLFYWLATLLAGFVLGGAYQRSQGQRQLNALERDWQARYDDLLNRTAD